MPPKQILIIEDEDIIRELISQKLEKVGYDVLSVKDAKEGLRLMYECRLDLVLLALGMPQFGGIELLEEIQKDSFLKHIPVIVISDFGDPMELDRAKELGAVDWLIKTEFDPQEVVEKVKRQIGG